MKSKNRMNTVTTPRICADAPEEIDEACISIESAIAAVTDGDDYWPDRIKQAFTKIGFEVQRLEREPHHPVWIIWLNVGSVDLPADKKAGAKQLRKSLVAAGLQIGPDEITILDRRGTKAKCVFVFGKVQQAIDLIEI
jgi:hypothetical protein